MKLGSPADGRSIYRIAEKEGEVDSFWYSGSWDSKSISFSLCTGGQSHSVSLAVVSTSIKCE